MSTCDTMMISLLISTVIKTVYIIFWLSDQEIQVLFRKQDPSTLAILGFISRLSIPYANLSRTSPNKAIAYRPYFNDAHNSNLAVLFFNLEAAFPCLKDTNIAPACSLFALEEDGFHGGRSLIQAADIGDNFRIFSPYQFIKTFGFGFAGCSTFSRSCVPESFERSIVCLLPSGVCT